MARPITQNRKEYQVARRKSYETKRRAVEDADPKLQRQLKEIEDQLKRRNRKAFTEKWQGEAETGVKTNFNPDSLDAQKVLGAVYEKNRRKKRAIAKSHARPTAKKPAKSKRFRVRSRKAGGTRRNKK